MAAKQKKASEKTITRLYKAVGKYVEEVGGNVVVANGISIIIWPGGKAHAFTVGIKCTGRKPKFEAPHGE